MHDIVCMYVCMVMYALYELYIFSMEIVVIKLNCFIFLIISFMSLWTGPTHTLLS